MSVVATAPVEAKASAPVDSLAEFTTALVKRAEPQPKTDKPVVDEKEQATSEPDKSADKPKADASAPSDETPDSKSEEKQDSKKAKSPEELHKELSSQAKANLKLGKDNADLKRKLAEQDDTLKRLEAKFDGTWKEPAEASDEEKAAVEKARTKVLMAKDLVGKQRGEDVVQAQIFAEDAPYRKIEQAHPYVLSRVMAADNPVEEAFTVLNEHKMFEQWGRDPEKVLAKAKEILKPILFKEFQQEIGGGEKPKATVPGLSSVRAAGNVVSEKTAPKSFSIADFNRHNAV